MKTKILIVEDQFIEANNLQMILERAGYEVCSIARSVPIALKIIARENPELVLLDIFLQGSLTGIDLARSLTEKNIAFVYLSANSNGQILDAAKATKPYGFLVKPFRERDVLVMLDVAWYLHQQKQDLSEKTKVFKELKTVQPADELKDIIGKSPKMQSVLENIRIVGHSDISVMILGESGTGKELVAKGIHQLSQRKLRPLVVVNCAALPANLIESELFGHEKGAFTGALNKRVGKFEEADQGTIFLDEIGELPMDLQVKFLRVLQEMEIERIGGTVRKINVRIIAATNRNLEEEVVAGRFRLDLYYRLNVFPILLPPLRERKADILLLADYFLRKYATKEGKTITGFADHVIQAILDYHWPGNVRELENLMARSVLLANGSIINSLILPKSIRQSDKAVEAERTKTIEENERDHIVRVLEKCDWKVYGEDGAAKLLNINVSTLNSKMKKLGIQKGKSF
ncbi:sigma-54 dependent transcriptional regulator [Dyadobacter sp. CY345]|uniref:sigma-54-dependent transcriptional regulator n=1 Tax=Dyadobacter sp. CY345 TaxID=2909335 RepID=UPI001F22F248|nr:sigma-54 dependent transcriptional regulator [Dyadobacter sp. CY345]MCF2446666.1 sigma-54 dependent transcriptional regulator [Dyadobacter sp. CY345]